MKLSFAYSALAALVLAACTPAEQKPAAEQGASAASATAPAEVKTVAITAIVEHPALDAVRKGVIEELAAEGYKEGENLKIDFQSAQGNTATAGQIAKKFAGDNPDDVRAESYRIMSRIEEAVAAASADQPVTASSADLGAVAARR